MEKKRKEKDGRDGRTPPKKILVMVLSDLHKSLDRALEWLGKLAADSYTLCALLLPPHVGTLIGQFGSSGEFHHSETPE